MVGVLLALPVVPASGLQVTGRVGADPHVSPRWWDRQMPNPLEHGEVGDRLAITSPAEEATAVAPSDDARVAVGTPPQPAVVVGMGRAPPETRRGFVKFAARDIRTVVLHARASPLEGSCRWLGTAAAGPPVVESSVSHRCSC